MGLQDGMRKVSEAAGARWRFYVRIMLGSCAEYPRIVFILVEAIQGFLAQILNSEFRGGRTIWWGLRVTLLAARIVKHRITWRDMTGHKKSHRIDLTWHATTSHHMTSHVANNHINSPQVTSQPTTLLHLNHATDHMTSKHITLKHMTSQPWNGRRLVHTEKLVWASRWSVALRTFYRQILSLLYISFPFWNFRPRLARELLVDSSKQLGKIHQQFNTIGIYIYNWLIDVDSRFLEEISKNPLENWWKTSVIVNQLSDSC